MMIDPRSCFLSSLLMVILLAGHMTQSDGRTERQKRTIGGRIFRRGQFPFLVLLKATIVTRRFLGVLPLAHNNVYCGGVLISNQWLLSAAHCFADNAAARRPGNWEAKLGAVRLRPSIREHLLDLVGRITNYNELRLWEVDVDRIVLHPGYNTTGFLSNDIALVKLERPIPRRRVSTLIQPIPLPSLSDLDFPNQNSRCVTMGWGCTASGGGPASIARQIPMPIRPSSTCSNHFYTTRLSMDRRVCAGYINAGVGICQGDSGSPLVCQTDNGYKLVGLASLTDIARPETSPAIFTEVKDYLPWIEGVLAQDRSRYRNRN